MDTKPYRPELTKSPLIQEIPLACADESAAVAFMERQRWGSSPCCPRCGDMNVYQMQDSSGARSARYLWRCRGCNRQYTVRTGTVYEDSKLPMRHWCYAFWRCATSKKGVSALEIARQCQITHVSALFLLNRIRFAFQPDHGSDPLVGTVEVDETYVGGEAKNMHASQKTKFGLGNGSSSQGKKDHKIAVMAVLERGGRVRTRVVADVTAENAKKIINDLVHTSTQVHTDESSIYRWIGEPRHSSVNHSEKEYVRGSITTNGIEGFFSIVKRGLKGIYHSVSRKHLHRYLAEFEFRFNSRGMCDGERLVTAIRQADGKRLMYRGPQGVTA